MSSSGGVAHQRTEQLRVLGEHDAHQQAAGTAAARAKLLGGGDAARGEIGCHRGEVLGNLVPARAHRLRMP